MKPYVSIDIETTGLNPETCQILEVAAVIDDWVTPIRELPVFHRYILYSEYHGEAFALAMNHELLGLLANTKEHDERFISVGSLGLQMFEFFKEHKLKNNISAAGKNFGTFDLQFLKNIGFNFTNYVTFQHRVIDPSMLYWKPTEDNGLPNMKTCLKRAEIAYSEIDAHHAVHDAIQAIQLIRKAFE